MSTGPMKIRGIRRETNPNECLPPLWSSSCGQQTIQGSIQRMPPEIHPGMGPEALHIPFNARLCLLFGRLWGVVYCPPDRFGVVRFK